MSHLVALLVLCGGPHDDGFAAAATVLSSHCIRCHNAEKTRGGLDLSSRVTAISGGATSDAIVPGDPETSFALRRARDHSMPPPKDGPPLTAKELERLTHWIAQGAVWPAAQVLSPLAHRPNAPGNVAEPRAIPAQRRRWSWSRRHR